MGDEAYAIRLIRNNFVKIAQDKRMEILAESQ